MSDRSKSGAAKRARLAAVILTAAMMLPGLAVADHTTCTPGSTSDPCGPFDPQLVAGAQVPFTDTPSSISFRWNQADHSQPVIGATYLVPKGWQFALNTLRQGEKPDGTPAASCADVYDGEENDHDDQAAVLARAENLAGGTGMTVAFTDTNIYTSPIPFRDTVRFGYTRGSRGGSNPSSQDPSIAFLGYDGTTARFCVYHYANDTLVDHNDDLDSQTSTAFGCNCIHDDAEWESSREHIIPVTMTRVAPGEILDGEDISTKFSWKISFDVKSVYEDPFLFDHETFITDHLFYFDAIAGGNWHVNPTTGQKEQIVFSRTPKTAGTYEFKAVFSTCSEGLQSPAPVCKNTDGDPSNDTLTFSRSVFQKILAPPTSIEYDFAKLTGPKGSLASVAGLNGFGMIRGTTEATFTWDQPPVAPTETVKGYLLVIAIPGQEDTRHFEYMITNDDDPTFDTREVCGPDGNAPSCSVTLNFPLSTIGDSALLENVKVNIALATLYEGHGTDMDFRSDGLCDDGIGFGVECPESQRAFRITGTGISTWQLLMRSDPWPMAFVQTMTVTRSGGGGSFLAPRYVLLVDFAKKRGEFVVWNAVDGPADVHAAASNGIVGDNSAGGVVSFFSPAIVGHAAQWRFDGFILPAGNATNVPPFIGDAIRPAAQAQGMFAKYDLKGLPGAIPPGGRPTAFTQLFQAQFKV